MLNVRYVLFTFLHCVCFKGHIVMVPLKITLSTLSAKFHYLGIFSIYNDLIYLTYGYSLSRNNVIYFCRHL